MTGDKLITEKHYRVPELAERWGISRSRLAMLFRNEPGVMRLGVQHFTLYIPESVAQRVHDRLSQVTAARQAPRCVIHLRDHMPKQPRKFIKLNAASGRAAGKSDAEIFRDALLNAQAQNGGQK